MVSLSTSFKNKSQGHLLQEAFLDSAKISTVSFFRAPLFLHSHGGLVALSSDSSGFESRFPLSLAAHLLSKMISSLSVLMSKTEGNNSTIVKRS